MGICRLPYYGWIIVAVSFVTYALVWGGVWSSFPIFLVAMIEEFGCSRSVGAGAFSLSILVIYLSGPFVGRCLTQYGPQRVMPVGGLLLAVGLFASSLAETIEQYYVAYGALASLGMSCLLFVPQNAVISRWFHRLRSTALGLALSGVGLGTMLLVPALQWIIENGGWRSAYRLLAAISLLVVTPLTALLQRPSPERMGLVPDGVAPPFQKDPLVRLPKTRLVLIDQEWGKVDWTPAMAIRTSKFWLIVLVYVTGSVIVVQTVFAHLAIYLVDLGYSKMFASKVIGATALIGSAGFIFWGVVSDRVGREVAFTIGAGCVVLGLATLLLLERSRDGFLIHMFVLLFGLGYGSRAPVNQSIAADIFQGEHFPSIYGGLCLAFCVTSLGPWLGGRIFENFQAYGPLFIILMGLMALSCVFVWLARPSSIRRVMRIEGRKPQPPNPDR